MTSKYEREIDEILSRVGSLPEEPKRYRVLQGPLRLARDSVGRLLDAGLPLIRVTPSGVLVASVIIAVLSFVVQAMQPQFAALLAVISVSTFFGAIGFSIVERRRVPAPKWRGVATDHWRDRPASWSGLRRRWRDWAARSRSRS
jgi:hypothetical protein